MLSPRQLYLFRLRKNISDDQLSMLLHIDKNEILLYEYGFKEIPPELYQKWESIVE